MAEPKKLRDDVAAKYSVKPGFGIGEMAFMGQTIQLDMITVDEADDLVKAGLDVLVLKKPAPVTTKP